MNFNHYNVQNFYDELIDENGLPREMALPLIEQINALPNKDLRRRQKAAERALYDQGITFSVYGNKKGAEKIFPFDIIPRVVCAKEWQKLEDGF